jgi:teichuronic acid biosynthesis glycosyltransferase TuaC
MRLFFVCKQFSLRRDFIADRYWRLWHLPAELARRGHAVAGIACSYRAVHAAGVQEQVGDGTLHWHACGLSPLRLATAWRWWRQREALARAHRPDVIVASSDALQLWAGRQLARRLRVPLVVDFYDNYESYGAGRVPGAAAAMRAAAQQAAGVSFIGEPVRDYLVGRYRIRAQTLTLENAVDEAFHAPLARDAARRLLKLPEGARLVGTAGALDASRNIGALYSAFERLAAADPRLHLVLAGAPRDVAPPRHPRVIRLGTLEPARMPAFWRSLDVAAIGLRDDAFGRYCYPQKLAEIAACGTPAVFPAIGVFARPGAERHGVAARSNDAAGMADAIREQLRQPRSPATPPRSWAEQAARFDTFVASLA